jgi:FixJ family two-component response regulator
LREGSGVAAVEKILRTGFLPHVFVSGNTLRAQSLTPGAVVIQKPFNESELLQAIERALGIAPAS